MEKRRKRRLIVIVVCVLAISASLPLVLLSKKHPMQPKTETVSSEILVTPADDSILHIRFSQIAQERIASLPIGLRVAKIGKLFLGEPYVGATLEVDSAHEDLVINLRGLDCVTFYENSLALARLAKKYAKPTVQNYADELALLRYRNGKREGYHSRLHYTTDYFANAEAKGLLRNVTAEVGGDLFTRDTATINFMTKHRALYKQIARNDSEFDSIAQMENNLNAQLGFNYIPKSKLSAVELKIETGDIIGIATNLPGLDFTHTGIAVREADARIHFLHASSLMHKVIITDVPLAEYLANNTHQIGVVVMRPVEILK